ncbi:helix-turn-helix domain-containing protein [Marinobacter halodurans]|uniref:Helix-turn-helix domain-containing protein n=1 Tax=Marinobacter halodurans TaxID=2528979 RepID=A0ABY1ZLQ9_9GAMM|nr:helix-turn-helix domain-containing protein [Marinobacter halodurans]TBW53370.1 helix-turn-helix domain-containing protein [Marinobacter halodurans]
MDVLIAEAAQALARGDSLEALKRVALRHDPPALALRGIAMARIGDLKRAEELLQDAARAFGPEEVVARARCVVAGAEIALVSRDLNRAEKALDAARITLDTCGDHINAAYARHLEIRLLVLTGQIDEAERLLEDIDPAPLPPLLQAAYQLVAAGVATRGLKTSTARAAIARAKSIAHDNNLPVLLAEIEQASAILDKPAALLIAGGERRQLVLEEIEALLASGVLVIDACRYTLYCGETVVPLATRPVLFTLARALAEVWPHDVSREKLLLKAFRARARDIDESHRARLRVEIGRLRRLLGPLATIGATKRGFALKPLRAENVVVLAPPVDDEHGAVLALLADGELWSSSALALALGVSARTVQRALEQLAARDKVQAFGRGRARRWTTPPPPGFTTTLLLPGPLPGR